MRNFVSDDGSLSFTAATALTGGRFYRSGGLVGIIAATVASGAVATLETCGVYEYEKAAEAIAIGDDLFWDVENDVLTVLPIGPRVGIATRAAESGDDYVRVMLAERASYGDRITVVGTYDFAEHGGAVGTITFGPDLPPGYYVDSAHYDVKTVPTSGGSATIALGFETIGATTVKAATAFDNAAYSSTGLKAASGPVAATPSTWLATDSAGKAFSITIATAALTGGKIAVAADLRRVA